MTYESEVGVVRAAVGVAAEGVACRGGRVVVALVGVAGAGRPCRGCRSRWHLLNMR